MQALKQFFNAPVRIICVALVVLWFAACIIFGKTPGAILPLLLVGLAISLGVYLPHYLLLKLKKITPYRWEHLLTTCAIAALLLYNATPLWAAFLTGVIIALVKTLVRSGAFPIFNPVAAGMVVSYYLLDTYPAWWGTSFRPRMTELGISVAVFITIPLGIYILKKYHKQNIAYAFLPTFIIFYLVTHGLGQLKTLTTLVLEGTVIFFISVMLIEPRTSPNLLKQQRIFGALVAALIVASLTWSIFPLPYTMSLLIGNALFAFVRLPKLTFNNPLLLFATQSSQSATLPPLPPQEVTQPSTPPVQNPNQSEPSRNTPAGH